MKYTMHLAVPRTNAVDEAAVADLGERLTHEVPGISSVFVDPSWWVWGEPTAQHEDDAYVLDPWHLGLVFEAETDTEALTYYDLVRHAARGRSAGALPMTSEHSKGLRLSEWSDWAEQFEDGPLVCGWEGQPATDQLFVHTDVMEVAVPECSTELVSIGRGKRACTAHRDAFTEAHRLSTEKYPTTSAAWDHLRRFHPIDPAAFQPGVTVSHKNYGEGTIVRVAGDEVVFETEKYGTCIEHRSLLSLA